MIRSRLFNACFMFVMTLGAGLSSTPVYSASLAVSESPLFVSTTVPPLTMLVMGKDHKLYYEAYNDATDLNGDSIVDVGYQGYHTGANVSLNVDYYGYFNSYVCYEYNASSGRFEPSSAKSASDIANRDKTCSGANEWSGDFLNYVTTARIDALRKVFYGGYRSTDSSSTTVLERTHIPQDAHAWGKEYKSIARDGYDIANYTPLAEPATDTYHLFANVSLLSTTSPYGSMNASATPRLRVLNDTRHRVWEWLSKERPVAGSQCINGLNGPTVNCETSGSSNWSIVPSTLFTSLSRSTYDISGSSWHPADEGEFDVLESTYSGAANLYGTDAITEIDDSGNPHGPDDQYMTMIYGQMEVPTSGLWTFAVDGDDAVEFSVLDGGSWNVVAAWYGGHGANSSDSSLSSHDGSILLTAGVTYNIRFRHEERGGGDSYALYYNEPTVSSAITDYTVRVEVCNGVDSTVSNSANNCQRYPNGNYKPTGLLHDFGEDDRMMFGLLTGSYENNLDGGVLRKAVSSFTDEVDSNDGTFTSVTGIVHTIDALKTVNFNDSSLAYSCGWITGRPINNGECDMWGNPVAEMMYETLRYFAGKGSATSDFDISSSGNNDAALGLPKASWSDPYDATTGYDECAAPFQVVVTDINPSYDSDKVPGSSFATFSGDVSGLDVSALADTITTGEGDIAGNSFFIGQSGTTYDNAPTAKTVSSLATIRGMAPEEPTKLGSYYASSLAYYGLTNDINARTGDQNLQTFSVALASPLPTIEIDVDQNPLTDNAITMVPFAKSSGQGSEWGVFHPTNQIVDFYVESLGATSGSFLINFEDVEQGADHDMDAIARYTYSIDTVNQTVTIDVDSVYAAGGIDQRMGYIISGTDHDGVYLEVRDQGGGDYVYELDTPSSIWAGDSRGTDRLGLSASRTFSPSGSGSASFLKDPLWYAAKWGGFVEDDEVANDLPDITTEWDADGDGDPDNYFLVTNALTLKQQMEAAFDEVLSRSGAASSLAVSSGSLNQNSILYQATFNTDGWYGRVRAIDFANGTLGSDLWEASAKLQAQLDASGGHGSNREIISIKDDGTGIPFRFPADYTNPGTDEMSTAQATELLSGISSDHQNYGEDLVDYLRGDDAEESGSSGASRNFRERVEPLGDIVHSDPLYVIQPGFFYPDTWPTTLDGQSATAPENTTGAQTYSAYRTLLKDRKHMLYVGANDGALHAINAYKNEGSVTDGGKEALAYVPGALYGKLPALASNSYTHDYYVDGKTTYSDVFFSNSTGSANNKWHTVLVGALRGGGQGIYALDITDPHGIASSAGYPDFDESNADEIVLWEFTDGDDADLGFTFGRPTITRLANGKWAAVFGNGYDNTESDGTVSSTGNAAIYIVDIESGTLIKKFDTGVGMTADPTGASLPNGMSEPAVVDVNGDYIADYIFAGDLFGNVWKVDLTDVNESNWDFADYSGGSPAPIFVATAADGTTRLPITQQPKVGAHPLFAYDGDLLVMFGTGKYFENGDTAVSGQSTQSIFGVWDDGSYGFDRSDLAVQTISEYDVTVNYDDDNDGTTDRTGTVTVRTVSQNEVRWEDEVNGSGTVTAAKHGGWVLDLVDSTTTPLDNKGERSVSNMNLRDGRLTVSTMMPSSNPCEYGGAGWIMIIDAATGGAYLGGGVTDVNNDDEINDEDMVDTDGDGTDDSHVAGVQVDGGFTQTTTGVDTGDGTVLNVFNESDGDIGTTLSIGNELLDKRLNWRELR